MEIVWNVESTPPHALAYPASKRDVELLRQAGFRWNVFEKQWWTSSQACVDALADLSLQSRESREERSREKTLDADLRRDERRTETMRRVDELRDSIAALNEVHSPLPTHPPFQRPLVERNQSNRPHSTPLPLSEPSLDESSTRRGLDTRDTRDSAHGPTHDSTHQTGED